MSRTALVGIAGGSGSGKTTLAQRLSEGMPPDQVQVVPLDAYYKDQANLPRTVRASLNYDHPEAFDLPLLLEQMRSLKRGAPVELPVYDYTCHQRRAETRPLAPVSVVILEGILVLAMPALLPLIDLKLFVETDPDLRLLRRVRRDVAQRGRTVDSVLQQYEETVRPMHQEFIEPSRAHADLILPGVGSWRGALPVLQAWVRAQAGPPLLEEVPGIQGRGLC